MIIPENARFLVTGGAGFIGSGLAWYLSRKGHEVVLLDDMSNGSPDTVRELSESENVTFIHGDIRDPEACRDAVEGVDYVLHHAARGSVPQSMDEPLLYDEVNVRGTLNLLDAARDEGVRKFVYASSSAVYGDGGRKPVHENKPLQPLSPYAATKKVNELYARQYSNLYGMETVGLRYFNVFGPRQNPHSAYSSVIPVFLKSLLSGRAPIVHGGGSQTRDFVYLDDVIQANIRACLSGPETAGQVFNIASGQFVSIMQLYRTVERLAGIRIQPEYSGARAGDITHSRADISRAERMLGFSPQTRLTEGIERTMAWYRQTFKVTTTG
ncbi:LPS biosynthesis protein WbpP [Alteribacter lacisalsi]|uniref:LPS biosynthesis protein WbpP n=1 Tax=Alteribacter lacisalsi TaxID=2045244 RepID=A0A2W0H731_9BACI|nr:SDR family oxidoreductase [Alteribacter lacisalsi]PYZ95910.1 LPS biosynthesis protein WbpP [Alteribacter lacisalsi]